MKDALPPIRKTLTVPLPPEAAFRLFIEKMGQWWPVESHSIAAANGETPKEVTVEPREGGQIRETTPDGTVHPWGRITRWEAGRQIDINWHVGRDEADATQVSVTFLPVEDGTQVELTHDGFARLGEVATAMHGNYASGWELVLGRYAARVQLVRGKVTA